MRILLSSLCLFILVGCASYPKKNGFVSQVSAASPIHNPYFSDGLKDYVYKAKINAFDQSFGGIFVVKKLEEKHHRIVFTTEIGNTIFDFEFLGDKFKINRILPEMDNSLLINVLKRDLWALIKEEPNIVNWYFKGGQTMAEANLFSKKHYYILAGSNLEKIVRIGGGKEKVTFLFSRINDNIAEEIVITHRNTKLKIALTLL